MRISIEEMDAALERYNAAKDNGTLDDEFPLVTSIKELLNPMTTDEIIAELGTDLYEVKQLVSGGWCAYSTTDRALGQTLKESLENLLKIVKEKRGENKTTLA